MNCKSLGFLPLVYMKEEKKKQKRMSSTKKHIVNENAQKNLLDLLNVSFAGQLYCI